jgi:hypothetical protein
MTAQIEPCCVVVVGAVVADEWRRRRRERFEGRGQEGGSRRRIPRIRDRSPRLATSSCLDIFDDGPNVTLLCFTCEQGSSAPGSVFGDASQKTRIFNRSFYLFSASEASVNSPRVCVRVHVCGV